MHPAQARGARGFTLVELLAALAILAILAALAAPSFSSLSASIRARAAGSDLYAALQRARSEAIKRNAEVALEPAATGKWQDGWSIPDPAAPGRKLDVHAAVKGGVIEGPAQVVFLPNGRVKGGGQPSFDISVSGSDQHRCITLDLGGRPAQANAECT